MMFPNNYGGGFPPQGNYGIPTYGAQARATASAGGYGNTPHSYDRSFTLPGGGYGRESSFSNGYSSSASASAASGGYGGSVNFNNFFGPPSYAGGQGGYFNNVFNGHGSATAYAQAGSGSYGSRFYGNSGATAFANAGGYGGATAFAHAGGYTGGYGHYQPAPSFHMPQEPVMPTPPRPRPPVCLPTPTPPPHHPNPPMPSDCLPPPPHRPNPPMPSDCLPPPPPPPQPNYGNKVWVAGDPDYGNAGGKIGHMAAGYNLYDPDSKDWNGFNGFKAEGIGSRGRGKDMLNGAAHTEYVINDGSLKFENNGDVLRRGQDGGYTVVGNLANTAGGTNTDLGAGYRLGFAGRNGDPLKDGQVSNGAGVLYTPEGYQLALERRNPYGDQFYYDVALMAEPGSRIGSNLTGSAIRPDGTNLGDIFRIPNRA